MLNRIVVVSNDKKRLEEYRQVLNHISFVDKFYIAKPEICITQFENGGIDFLVTDIDLSYIDGVEMVEKLNRNNPNMKVCYIARNIEEAENTILMRDEMIIYPLTKQKLQKFCEINKIGVVF